MSLILDIIFPRVCVGCGQKGDYLCQNCLSQIYSLSVKPPEANLDGIVSLFKYHPPIKELITELKFNLVTDSVDRIASIISVRLSADFPTLLKYWQENNYVLIPVPLHQYRQNYRGFNQSQLVVSALAKLLNLTSDSKILIRTRASAPQSTQKRTQRQTNISGSYQLNASPPPNIILFDDVCTTGATLKSAASVFPSSTRIWALTIAG